MIAFIDIAMGRYSGTAQALDILHKFERLGLPNMYVEEKYQNLLQKYMHELDQVSKLYLKLKNEPPVGRDLPPVSGVLLILYRN